MERKSSSHSKLGQESVQSSHHNGVLNPYKKRPLEESPRKDNIELASSISNSTQKRRFNVVYGKPSQKKHKNWEDDGTLEVDLVKVVATLFDTNGKVIETKSKISNLENYESGFETHIGSKFVQILEEIKESPGEEVTVAAEKKREAWKPLTKKSKFVLHHNKTDAAILPTPKLGHQILEEISDVPEPTKNMHPTHKLQIGHSSALSNRSLLVNPLISKRAQLSNIGKKSLSHSKIGQESVQSIHHYGVLNPYKKRPLEESPKKDNIELTSNISDSSQKRRFNVVYGKPSQKKHKIWEDDGTLEVDLVKVVATLLDTNGKVIETKSKISNLENYESGFETHVGSKYVQILEEIKESPCEEVTVAAEKKREAWKPLTKKSKFVLHHDETDALILPTPKLDHQWKYNIKGVPIVSVQVESFLTRVLKPHQREGVQFLYTHMYDINYIGSKGALLADEMGLGKTLQCIALIWTILRQGPYGSPIIKNVLIVTPSSLTSNWNDEFKKWLGTHRLCPYLVDKRNKVEDYVYSKASPVLIISYDMLLRSIDFITNLTFSLLICDEGHRLKNGKSKLYEVMNSLKVEKKIVLTGTPLQNDLQEFYFLNDFINPGVLGSLKEFKKKFEEPILESRRPDCSEGKKSLGELRSSQLSNRTNVYILRRTSEVNVGTLPPKHEYVVVCRTTPLQQKMYQSAVDYWSDRTSGNSHLAIMHALRKICNHPGLVQDMDDCEEETQDDLKSFLSQQWNLISDLKEGVLKTLDSGKLVLLQALLQHLKLIGKEKVILVSYFTLTLNLFEVLCVENKYDYLRLDGSTNVQNRKNIVDQFNDPSSPYFILLLSAKAGGVGLNLIGASRLVLYDSDWNPATDLQAMARIWRHGQRKSVHIYRMLSAGTVEEKIFQRQISKADLTKTVINEFQSSDLESKMSLEDLKDLFTFEPRSESYIHSSLRCECRGTGDPLTPSSSHTGDDPDDEEEEDESFLDCFKKSKPTKNVSPKNKQHLLMSWNHFSTSNLTSEMLETLGFTQNSHFVSFLFSHSSN